MQRYFIPCMFSFYCSVLSLFENLPWVLQSPNLCKMSLTLDEPVRDDIHTYFTFYYIVPTAFSSQKRTSCNYKHHCNHLSITNRITFLTSTQSLVNIWPTYMCSHLLEITIKSFNNFLIKVCSSSVYESVQCK